MMTDKDIEQDALIQQNAEHIRRNEEAIRRQTEALEKIRDHYFPKKTITKRAVGFLLKVVGAITVYTGMMEATEWYVNTRRIEGMAEQSVAVARRLIFEENDMAGAQRFLERAVELDGNNATYRTMLGYVRGMATIVDLLDAGRPLADWERGQVDEILAEAIYLQTIAPDDPMPYVLTAQAYVLRNESALAEQAVARAVAIAPDNILVRCSGCAIRFFVKDFATARTELAAAERLQPEFPLVLYWRGMLAATLDRDFAKARECFGTMSRRSPRLALPHAMLGWAMMNDSKPDLAAARTEFERALALNPQMKRVLLMLGELCEKEGRPAMARIWYDRAIECDGRYLKALLARARVYEAAGEWEPAMWDWDQIVALDPLHAESYRERAKAKEKRGDKTGAASDRRIADELDRP